MHQEDRIINKIELKNAIVALRDDEIIHIYFKENVEINVELQLEILEACQMLASPGKKYPYIYEAGEFLNITNDARAHAVFIEHKHPSTHFVMYVKNLAQKILSDHYYKNDNPKRPFSVVRDFQEGINWLNNHKLRKR